jgi:hypothetical protein
MIKHPEEASARIDTAVVPVHIYLRFWRGTGRGPKFSNVRIPYVTRQIHGVLLYTNTMERKLLLKSRALIGRVIEWRSIRAAHIALIIIVPQDNILCWACRIHIKLTVIRMPSKSEASDAKQRILCQFLTTIHTLPPTYLTGIKI